MCFVVPLKVIKKKGKTWEMEDGRVVRKALTDEVKIGDYLVCQHDVAVERLSKAQAKQMRSMIKGVSDELKTRN